MIITKKYKKYWEKKTIIVIENNYNMILNYLHIITNILNTSTNILQLLKPINQLTSSS